MPSHLLAPRKFPDAPKCSFMRIYSFFAHAHQFASFWLEGGAGIQLEWRLHGKKYKEIPDAGSDID
jgi:hypothetical protein